MAVSFCVLFVTSLMTLRSLACGLWFIILLQASAAANVPSLLHAPLPLSLLLSTRIYAKQTLCPLANCMTEGILDEMCTAVCRGFVCCKSLRPQSFWYVYSIINAFTQLLVPQMIPCSEVYLLTKHKDIARVLDDERLSKVRIKRTRTCFIRQSHPHSLTLSSLSISHKVYV